MDYYSATFKGIPALCDNRDKPEGLYAKLRSILQKDKCCMIPFMEASKNSQLLEAVEWWLPGSRRQGNAEVAVQWL